MKTLILTAIAGLGSLLFACGTWAGDRLDHDEVKQLRETGQILPMGEVMAGAQSVQPGQLVEAELEREDGVYLYEIKILAADGSVHELYLDASTAEVIQQKRDR